MRARFLRLFSSPSLYSAILMATGGVALACANLILAKVLDINDFGRVVLFQAMASIAIGVAPLGVDSLLVRRELGFSRKLLSRIPIIACSLAILFACGDFLFDNRRTTIDEALLFGLACFGGGIARLAICSEQSRERFWHGQLISQAPYLCFLLFSIVLLFIESPTWRLGLVAFVLGQLIGAALGFAITEENHFGEPGMTSAGFRSRAFSFLAIFLSVLLLSNLERLVVAGCLGLEAVATFGVAATLIVSPYRILAAGIGFTLMPRLVKKPSGSIKRKLLLEEVLVATVFGVLGGILLLLLAPLLISTLYEDKFRVPPILLICLLISGLIRTAYGIVSASVGGIGDTRTLRQFNLYGWLGTGVAAVAAILLSSVGPSGVVVGVGLGWVIRIFAGLILMRTVWK